VCDLTRALESSSLEDESQQLSSRAKDASNSLNNTNTGSSLFSGSSTTRTPGIFGRATNGAFGHSLFFGGHSSKSNTNTVKGSGAQNVIASIGSSGSASTDTTRGFGQYTSGLGTTYSSSESGLYGYQSAKPNNHSGSEYVPSSDNQSDSDNESYSVAPTVADSASELDHDSESDDDCRSENSSDSWTPRGRRSHNR
jgi:hypothetical protein